MYPIALKHMYPIAPIAPCCATSPHLTQYPFLFGCSQAGAELQESSNLAPVAAEMDLAAAHAHCWMHRWEKVRQEGSAIICCSCALQLCMPAAGCTAGRRQKSSATTYSLVGSFCYDMLLGSCACLPLDAPLGEGKPGWLCYDLLGSCACPLLDVSLGEGRKVLLRPTS